MTIPYSDNFGKLLFRWKGSLWKAVFKDLLVFLFFYYAINFTYRFALNKDQKSVFESFIALCEKSATFIPLTFLLGFFVSTIVTRWWDQFKAISWPDKFMLLLSAYLNGQANLHIRRTIGRWLNLTSVLCWRNLSMRTLKRFPTHEHLLKSGLMTSEEMQIYRSTIAPFGKWWLPLTWASTILKKCHDDKLIDSSILRHLLDELLNYRSGFSSLMNYSWVNVPLVYTQVVTLATYGYFIICLISRQIVGHPDIYVPVFTILQFLFYVGWLKVGQYLMNPFGEDDDDFELNYLLDRNIQMAYMIAEIGQMPNYETTDVQPNLMQTIANLQIPHTKASSKIRDVVFKGHLSDVKFDEDDLILVYPDCVGCITESNGAGTTRKNVYITKGQPAENKISLSFDQHNIPMIDSKEDDEDVNIAL